MNKKYYGLMFKSSYEARGSNRLYHRYCFSVQDPINDFNSLFSLYLKIINSEYNSSQYLKIINREQNNLLFVELEKIKEETPSDTNIYKLIKIFDTEKLKLLG